MTIELEQKFYDTFDIEPKYKTCIFRYCRNKKEYDCDNCGDRFWHYPEITAEKLLEIICILNKEAVYGYSDWGGNFIIGETVEELKESILTDCIRNKSKVLKQIQQLFKDNGK